MIIFILKNLMQHTHNLLNQRRAIRELPLLSWILIKKFFNYFSVINFHTIAENDHPVAQN
jgi:hypothetical protein